MMEKRMNIIHVFIMLFLCAGIGTVSAQEAVQRNYLSATLRTAAFGIDEAGLSVWRIAEQRRYREAISQLPEMVKKQIAAKADEAMLFDWPILRASLFLEFRNNGNRIRYERKQNERRARLSQLAIGCLVTGDKKYLPALADGLWATLEESTWEIPAIVAIQKIKTDLPDPSEQVIGLVSAETAAVLAAIRFMLHDQLDEVSPVINERISAELNKRIFDPYIRRDDYWWMGFTGKPVNNWNVWINSNVLLAAMFAAQDASVVTQLLPKILGSTDHFINQYPDDGGCDEGPAYWSLAGGKLASMLVLLKNISGGKLDFSNNTLFHRIGSYISKMHIAGDYFVNFADASAHVLPDPVSVYRFGDLYHDDSLKQFASYLFSLKTKPVSDSNVVDFLSTATCFRPLSSGTGKPLFMSTSSSPDLQVYTARSFPLPANNMFLAVQGGHNGESHNHNDVGNFILYAKGKPVIIDAGVGTYTAQTFSAERYELWNMQSQWHNCPTINGVMQKEGPAFGAKDLRAFSTDTSFDLKMDIAGAYPTEAHVRQWERRFSFNQVKSRLVVQDQYFFSRRSGETIQHLLTACEVRLLKPGTMVFVDKEGNQLLQLEYPAALLLPTIEEKRLDDERIQASWGAKIYRVSFSLTGTALRGSTFLLFTVPQ